jgi:hypothetical protein
MFEMKPIASRNITTISLETNRNSAAGITREPTSVGCQWQIRIIGIWAAASIDLAGCFPLGVESFAQRQWKAIWHWLASIRIFANFAVLARE